MIYNAFFGKHTQQTFISHDRTANDVKLKIQKAKKKRGRPKKEVNRNEI